MDIWNQLLSDDYLIALVIVLAICFVIEMPILSYARGKKGEKSKLPKDDTTELIGFILSILILLLIVYVLFALTNYLTQ